jgi:dolichol-phosphate mannosyltransferase
VGTPDISLIIPALNEAPNLAPLLEQIAAAVGSRAYEVIIVDDHSRDNTAEVCAELSKSYPLRLIVREHPSSGLSGAVLAGMAEARGELLVVMDADLQHPPAKIPELLAPLERGEADFVLGSRYVPGGSTFDKWTLFRRINSGVATFLARPFAGNVTDPMSGFFALKREAYQGARRLTPLGYKIALELMCKARARNVREIPIHFAQRARGESKLTLAQQFRYLEHLSRLYDFTYPRASPVVKFLIVLAVSWVAALVGYLALSALGMGRVQAVTGGYVASIAVTAMFHLRYVRTQREFLIRRRPWVDFAAISLAEIIACALAAMWIRTRVSEPSMWDDVLIPFGIATVVRYVLRKELLQDVRGLRREIRREELE